MMLSNNKEYLLKMVPSHWEKEGKTFIKKRTSIGTIFKLNPNGDLQYQWNSKELFPSEAGLSQDENTLSSKAYKIFISDDGSHVIKVKLYASHFDDNAEKKKDFIHILNNGKLKYKYSYSEFIKNNNFTKYSSCAGTGLLNEKSMSLKDKLFNFELANKEKFKVNIISGEKAFVGIADSK